MGVSGSLLSSTSNSWMVGFADGRAARPYQISRCLTAVSKAARHASRYCARMKSGVLDAFSRLWELITRARSSQNVGAFELSMFSLHQSEFDICAAGANTMVSPSQWQSGMRVLMYAIISASSVARLAL